MDERLKQVKNEIEFEKEGKKADYEEVEGILTLKTKKEGIINLYGTLFYQKCVISPISNFLGLLSQKGDIEHAISEGELFTEDIQRDGGENWQYMTKCHVFADEITKTFKIQDDFTKESYLEGVFGNDGLKSSIFQYMFGNCRKFDIDVEIMVRIENDLICRRFIRKGDDFGHIIKFIEDIARCSKLCHVSGAIIEHTVDFEDLIGKYPEIDFKRSNYRLDLDLYGIGVRIISWFGNGKILTLETPNGDPFRKLFEIQSKKWFGIEKEGKKTNLTVDKVKDLLLENEEAKPRVFDDGYTRVDLDMSIREFFNAFLIYENDSVELVGACVTNGPNEVFIVSNGPLGNRLRYISFPSGE